MRSYAGWRSCTAWPAGRVIDRLARFREAFVRRYEGREVPLVEALDDETGVGFDTLTGEARDASSLLDGLTFPKAAEETVTWGRREAVLLRRLGEALTAGATQIVLSARRPGGDGRVEPAPAA